MFKHGVFACCEACVFLGSLRVHAVDIVCMKCMTSSYGVFCEVGNLPYSTNWQQLKASSDCDSLACFPLTRTTCAKLGTSCSATFSRSLARLGRSSGVRTWDPDHRAEALGSKGCGPRQSIGPNRCIGNSAEVSFSLPPQQQLLARTSSHFSRPASNCRQDEPSLS